MAFCHYNNSEENGSGMIGSASASFPSGFGSQTYFCMPECYYLPQHNDQALDSFLPQNILSWKGENKAFPGLPVNSSTFQLLQ